MYFTKNSSYREVLHGEIFNWYHDYFLPLPEKFYHKLDFQGRILGWEADDSVRILNYCSLGNLCWGELDYNVFKWQLSGSGDDETSNSSTSSQKKKKALKRQQRADISDLLTLVRDDKWKTIRQNTHDFNNALMIFITLNKLALESDGFYHYDIEDIKYQVEQSYIRADNRNDFSQEYETLIINRNEYSKEVMDYVMNMSHYPNVSDYYYSLTMPKHLKR